MDFQVFSVITWHYPYGQLIVIVLSVCNQYVKEKKAIQFSMKTNNVSLWFCLRQDQNKDWEWLCYEFKVILKQIEEGKNKHEKSSRSLGPKWGGLCQVEVSLTILKTEDITRHHAPYTGQHRSHRSVYRVCPRLKM